MMHTKHKSKNKHLVQKNAKVKKINLMPVIPKTPKEIAMDFAIKVHRKFSDLVKATILFGSQAKNQAKSTSDIDMIIIIDDAGINWDLELVAWYREELAKLISANDYADELHINTIKITTWWSDLMHGDPVVINILRYGESLIDLGGFFKPQKALLLQGKIYSTPEAVYAALQRAPAHLARSEYAQLSAVEGIYWTMVDSAHAALITVGKLPPSPEHIAEMLDEIFVERRVLPKDYVQWFREIFSLHKGIAHGEIRKVKGLQIDEWQEKANKFLGKMAEIINNLIDAKKQQDSESQKNISSQENAEDVEEND
jgi:predicted nucleotidyltransferase/uncharacterized protein (UPF0332 family)